ncbi:hypothetical protein AMTR_s00039p00150750, partial [Amborella trichopoda]
NYKAMGHNTYKVLQSIKVLRRSCSSAECNTNDIPVDRHAKNKQVGCYQATKARYVLYNLNLLKEQQGRETKDHEHINLDHIFLGDPAEEWLVDVEEPLLNNGVYGEKLSPIEEKGEKWGTQEVQVGRGAQVEGETQVEEQREDGRGNDDDDEATKRNDGDIRMKMSNQVGVSTSVRLALRTLGKERLFL